MVDFTPDGIAHRSFRTTLRGFDQHEVREFLAQLATSLSELVDERDHLAATLKATDGKDLQAEIDLVSNEIREVLETARAASETMRERAAAETARWRSEAIAEAERSRREAAADAEHLRTDAWTTSETLLTQVQREVERLRGEAEKEALRLVGEAEREAHRAVGAARREAEEALRAARMEAEKLVLDARASHDEIIETATRKAEVAQERTRALEERRDELRRELDGVRAAIAAVESELDERREALGLTASLPEAASRELLEQWVPGETVRVVRPGSAESAAEEFPVVSEPRTRPDPTPELRVLSPEELRRRQHGDTAPVPPAADAAPAEVAVEETVTPEPELVPEHEPEPEPQPESEPEVEPTSGAEPEISDRELPAEDAPEATEGKAEREAGEGHVEVVDHRPVAAEDDLGAVEGLFARLREPIAAEPETASQDERAEERQLADSATDDTAENAAANGAGDAAGVAPVAVRSFDVDPFEVRDGLLLPITNRALRNVKRQLTEEQNAALERIRIDHSAWEPDPTALEQNLRPDLVVLTAESFAAGHAAAETLTSEKLTRPAAPSEAVAGRFVAALCADLERALTDGRAHGHGARETAADVSRVFRAWRTDESERRIRHHSYAAFNRGLVATLAGTGTPGVRWVVAGRGCALCRDMAGRDEIDEPPPAHEGCGCTVVPV